MLAVKNLGKSRSGSSSHEQSQENRRGQDDSHNTTYEAAVQLLAAAAAAVPLKELPEEEIERKTKSTMDENLHLPDLMDKHIQEELDRLIINKAVDNSNIFDWIKVRIKDMIYLFNRAWMIMDIVNSETSA